MAAANPTYNWLGQVRSGCKGVLNPLHYKYYFRFHLKLTLTQTSVCFPWSFLKSNICYLEQFWLVLVKIRVTQSIVQLSDLYV